MKAQRSPYKLINPRRKPHRRIVGTGNTNTDAFPDGACSPPKALEKSSHGKANKD